jgi:hypothetical protein
MIIVDTPPPVPLIFQLAIFDNASITPLRHYAEPLSLTADIDAIISHFH